MINGFRIMQIWEKVGMKEELLKPDEKEFPANAPEALKMIELLRQRLIEGREKNLEMGRELAVERRARHIAETELERLGNIVLGEG